MVDNGGSVANEKLVKTLKSVFGEQEFPDDATPDKVKGWDSLTHMDLVSRLEEEFGLHFDIDDVTAMTSVGEIRRILRKNGVAL